MKRFKVDEERAVLFGILASKLFVELGKEDNNYYDIALEVRDCIVELIELDDAIYKALCDSITPTLDMCATHRTPITINSDGLCNIDIDHKVPYFMTNMVICACKMLPYLLASEKALPYVVDTSTELYNIFVATMNNYKVYTNITRN